MLLVVVAIISLTALTLWQAFEAPGASTTIEATLTARAIAHKMSTAKAIDATATIVAEENATATAKAQATATIQAENPYPIYFFSSGPMQGTLAFYDPMSDNSHSYKWSINSPEVGSCSFQQGVYHAIMNTVSGPARFHPCIAQASPRFSNFAYEVHVKIITGEYSDAIKQGPNQDNLIAVVANGPKIDLYVNQNKIDSVTDTAYSQGNIGVLARGEVEQTDAVFSNARVWTF